MQIADFKNMLLISYQIDNSFNSYPMAKKFAQHVSPPKKRKEKKPNLEITYIPHGLRIRGKPPILQFHAVCAIVNTIVNTRTPYLRRSCRFHLSWLFFERTLLESLPLL